MSMPAAIVRDSRRDRLRVELGVGEQRARRRQGVVAAAADGDGVAVGFDHVAGAADEQRALLVGHEQERLEPPQVAIRAPFLGQLDGGAREVLVVALQLGLELLEEREGVGRGAGEPRQHPRHRAGAHLDGVPFITVVPRVTWPSPHMTTRRPRRTARMVVP
jgi:hypothetical protein